MKIVVIEGDNEIKARARYRQIVDGVKAKNWRVVDLDALPGLRHMTNVVSLFNEECLYVSEKLGKYGAHEMKWLRAHSDKLDLSVLFYHEGKMGVSLRNTLPKNVKFEKFEQPKMIFDFLDNLYPTSLSLIDKLHPLMDADHDGFLLFAMISGRLRDLYWLSMGGHGMSMQDWQKGKLRVQAGKFESGVLSEWIMGFALVDLQIKSGQVGLKAGVEMFFIERTLVV